MSENVKQPQCRFALLVQHVIDDFDMIQNKLNEISFLGQSSANLPLSTIYQNARLQISFSNN